MISKFTREQQHTVYTTIRFIQDAHYGQVYGDMPYYLHPIDVAERIETPSFEEYMAALLHDVIEDTSCSEDYLREMLEHLDTGDRIVDIVLLVTKDNTLSYEQNIQRIVDSGNVKAMRVKRADNWINFGGDKSHMSHERRNKLMTRYKNSIITLTYAITLLEDWQSGNAADC